MDKACTAINISKLPIGLPCCWSCVRNWAYCQMHSSVNGKMSSGAKKFSKAWRLRKALSEDEEVPENFSRPEVLEVLRKYYAGIAKEDRAKVELKGHSAK